MTDDSSLRTTVQCESSDSGDVVGQPVHAPRTLTDNALTGNPLLLTVLSAIAFFVAGTWAWSLKFVLLLFPILLLHELGHFAAMKLFGYRDVRLFFVPLLGAAVAGHSESGSITQRVTVCLAGPIPGLAIAVAFWSSGLTTTNETVSAFAIMLLAINGFNLLPILPLDGGWLIQSLLLARRPWLEFTFRCLTILILLTTAIATQIWLVALIAIPFTTGLKSALHFCRIQSRLFSQTGKRHPEKLEDSNTGDGNPVYHPSDELILQAVREEFPGAILTEKTAKQWLQRIHTLIRAPQPKLPVAFAICAATLILIAGSGAIMLQLVKKDHAEPVLRLDPWQHEY